MSRDSPSLFYCRLYPTMFDLVLWIVFSPMMWFIRGIVGILCPAQSPELILAQRLCAVAAVVAGCAFVSLCVFITLQFSRAACISAFAVWFLSTAIAGALGYWIEQQAKL